LRLFLLNLSFPNLHIFVFCITKEKWYCVCFVSTACQKPKKVRAVTSGRHASHSAIPTNSLGSNLQTLEEGNLESVSIEG
jgi:hypothetical protein